ncbi:MAG: SCO family protein, partial [Planctomycetaceae bacterium]|nr:SCO family protein [Planctomycetaceae bacterium]
MTETKRTRRIPLILIIMLWVLVAVSAFATWKLKTQHDLALEQIKATEAAQKKAAEETKETEIEGVTIKTPIWPEEGIEDFSLTERSGKTVTKEDLLGKPWVACFVFTRCAGPCPRVSGQFYQLQKDLKDQDFRLVTFTVDPKNDTPDVLSRYAESVGADPEKWLFLTGDQNVIFHLIEKSFLMPVEENKNPARKPGFEVIHTTNVMLVDKDGRVLGKYNAINDVEMAELRREVRKLVNKEEEPKPDTKKPEEQPQDSPENTKPVEAAKPKIPAKAGMI